MKLTIFPLYRTDGTLEAHVAAPDPDGDGASLSTLVAVGETPEEVGETIKVLWAKMLAAADQDEPANVFTES